MPPDLEPALRDPIAEAQRRSERLIGYTAIAIGVLGAVVASWRIATVEAAQGLRILAVAAVVGGGYATFVLRRPRPSKPERWLRATLEVSFATVVMLLDGVAGAQYLVSSSTAFLYPLVIALTVLRLEPRLTAYATALAISQHLALSLYTFAGPEVTTWTGAFSLSRLQQELLLRVGVMAMMGGLGAVLATTLRREIAGAADEERVRTAFGHYVDRRVVRRVLAGDLRIAPERRDVTVLFVDIRDFTRMSENSDPADVFRKLSGALDAFSQAVQQEGGIVNKYLGDGLLAFFGAPEEQPDHSRRAVRAALNIAAVARGLGADARFPGLKVGIGIHAGPVMVGDLGGDRREYTAVGDVVNVASRIEAVNKELGTTILATRWVIDRVGDGPVVRQLPPRVLRGREAPVDLYEVLGLEATELSMGARNPGLS